MTLQEYNKCVENFSDGLYRFIFKNLKDEEYSRDIVQESFEILWINVDSVYYEKAKSYLFTTGYHAMIDWIRREKKKIDFEQVNVSRYSHEEQYTDIKEVLNLAVETLPEKQKTVVLLRDYEGYSYKDIAEITGFNESQVKVYIYRARLALKEFIGKIEFLV
ncbi:RNA polymerase sigma factor [Bacteroidota bacterium]